MAMLLCMPDTAPGGELQTMGWDLCKVLDPLRIKLWEALRLEPLKPPRNAQASSESGLEGEVLLLQLFAAVFCLSLFPFIPPFSCHLMTRPRPLWVQEQGRCPRGAAVLGLWVCFFLPPPCAPARVRRCRNNRGHYSYHGDSDSGRDASFLTQTALFHLLCFSKPLSFCMRRQM